MKSSSELICLRLLHHDCKSIPKNSRDTRGILHGISVDLHFVQSFKKEILPSAKRPRATYFCHMHLFPTLPHLTYKG